MKGKWKIYYLIYIFDTYELYSFGLRLDIVYLVSEFWF